MFMFKRLSQREIKNNWSTYKQHIKKALESTEGCQAIMSSSSLDLYKNIYGYLLSPYEQSMHIWMDNKKEFLQLTAISVCELSGNKTLLFFAGVRLKEVDKKTLDERWVSLVKTVSKFAKENDCVGMYTYSDLDYFAQMAERNRDLVNVITRYQFYFPLN